MKCLRLLLTGALVLGTAGCGRSNHTPVYPVSGKVLYKGKPADGAVVTLVPADDATTPRPGAQVRRDGSFRLSTFASYDGAPAGRYAVTVVYRSPVRKVDDENVGPDLLRGRYSDPRKTPLHVEIQNGKNTLGPFDLK